MRNSFAQKRSKTITIVRNELKMLQIPLKMIEITRQSTEIVSSTDRKSFAEEIRYADRNRGGTIGDFSVFRSYGIRVLKTFPFGGCEAFRQGGYKPSESIWGRGPESGAVAPLISPRSLLG